jgi:uncharacterized cofD-like protein
LTEGHPRVVAIGGGHGLAATLRAVRRYASHTTAIVSVADDGGSSGRLRQTLGIPAPGDARRCLVALAEDDALWAEAFEHRFTAPGLVGHAFGNLVIAGLAQVTGDFTAALDEAGRLVGAVGRVLPATAIPVSLHAETADGPIDGQVAIAGTPRITHVSLVPADAKPPPAALDALADADQVVLGPGSLFTSVLAAAVVPALRDALEAASARVVYVANLREQPRETEGLDVAAHVDALAGHGIDVDVVLCDPGGPRVGELRVERVVRQVARPHGLAHDPALLASALRDLVS